MTFCISMVSYKRTIIFYQEGGVCLWGGQNLLAVTEVETRIFSQIRTLIFCAFGVLSQGWGSSIFFLRRQRGQNFLCMPRGGPKFCACKGGGQKKLATGDHKQTPPLPVKYDSSLIVHYQQRWSWTVRLILCYFGYNFGYIIGPRNSPCPPN